jgi:hypothetical protein
MSAIGKAGAELKQQGMGVSRRSWSAGTWRRLIEVRTIRFNYKSGSGGHAHVRGRFGEAAASQIV